MLLDRLSGSTKMEWPALARAAVAQGSRRNTAFVYNGGEYTTIDPPGGISPTAYSINNRGQIVGDYYSAGTEHGFIANPRSHDHLASELNAVSGLKGADTFVFPSTFGDSINNRSGAHNQDEVKLAHSQLADLTAPVAEHQQDGLNAVIAHDPNYITTPDYSASHNPHAHHFLL
jgi:hypothetical protein